MENDKGSEKQESQILNRTQRQIRWSPIIFSDRAMGKGCNYDE